MKSALVFLVFLCAPTLAFSEEEKTDTPNVKVGDTWKFKVLDKISRQPKSEYTLVVTELTDTRITTNSKGVWDREWRRLGKDADSVDLQSSPKRFDFPLFIGKAWRHEYNADWGDNRKAKFDMKAKVVGWEDVTVPAGTFHALRVEHDGLWRDQDNVSGRYSATYWYAPEVRYIVQMQTSMYTRAGGLSSGTTDELQSMSLQ